MNQIPLVAIIDDDHSFQFMTRTLLDRSRKVKNIVQFRDGEEAFDYFIANKNDPDRIPDLLFVDIQMPYLTGWQLLKKLIKSGMEKQINTVVICSSSERSSYTEFSDSFDNLDAFLEKPLSRDDIEKVLDKKLNEMIGGNSNV
ncbi:MAG: response regulator [Sphingobacteriaceae bacterium]|nr:response regulator [Sphingobacteriaceae bacterium]